MSKQSKGVAQLRLLCLLEAGTLLVLMFIAVPLKHLGGYAWAVSFTGPVHGLVFLVLCWAVTRAVAMRDISTGTAWRLILAACIPFGGIASWMRLGMAEKAHAGQAAHGGRP